MNKPAKMPTPAATGRRRSAGKNLGRGMVRYLVNVASAKVHPYSPTDMVRVLVNGLPVEELNDLQARLNLPMDKLSAILGMSKATLHRRKSTGYLAQAESDRVVRYARLFGKAVEVLESDAAARSWLNSPQIGLGGEIPLIFAQTEVGAREVENLLGRIEFGVFS